MRKSVPRKTKKGKRRNKFFERKKERLMNPFGQGQTTFGDYREQHTIIVDPGKYDVKIYDVKGNTIRYVGSFPSRLKNVLSFHGQEALADNVFKVSFNGKKALVGTGDYSTETTKSNFHHQMCIYAAIGLVAEHDEHINLVIGQPSSDYSNEDELNEYSEVIKGNLLPTPLNGHISIEFEGKTKTFHIDDLRVYPEGMATFSRLVNGRNAYHIIDLGGKNLNYRFYDVNGTLVQGISLDKAGMNHLATKLEEELRTFIKAGEFDLSAIDFEEAVRTRRIPIINEIPNVGTVEEFINFYVNDFIEKEIERKLANHLDFRKKGHKIIFTGGGTLLLKSYLEERYADNIETFVFSKRARFDNCSSYLLSYVRELAAENKLNPEEAKKIFNDYGNQINSDEFEARRRLPNKKKLSEFDMVINSHA